MIKRAYSLIEIKAVNEDERIIEGIATTPATDRMEDIVEPMGAEFELPLPFLWQHDSYQPIGHVIWAKPQKDGIPFKAQIVQSNEPGTLKDRLDEAWQSLKLRLVRGVSIGFKALEYNYIEGTNGIRFLKWAWLELSAVTIPANQEATITAIKSADIALRAASGKKQFAVVRLTPPASGKSSIQTPKEGNMKVSEKIRRFEEKRAANVARIAAIHEGSDESLNDAEMEEVKGLEAENATIDRDLPSLKNIETALASKAAPVVAATHQQPLVATPGVQIVLPPEPEKGIRFARYARCIGLAHQSKSDVMRVAEALYGKSDPKVVEMIKAAGTAIGALNTTTDAALVGNTGGFVDFVEFLRARTIIGRFGTDGIPSLRNIPFRVPLVSQATGGSAYWVGEGDGKPVTKPSFGRTELAPLKVAAISVATMELLRDSSPSAERLLRDDLAAAVTARLDVTFVDPTVASSAGVSPASISYGAESIVAQSGGDADDIRLDVRAVMQKFVDAKNPLTSGVWIMSSANALALAIMKNTLGQPEFPGLTINGGTFMGLPVIVSDYVTDYVVLVNANDIWFGDDGGMNIDMSTEASLQMVAGDDEGSTQNSVTPVATQVVSLWQTNSVGFRAERTVNWARRRSSAVAYLTGVQWGGAVPAS